MKNNLFILYLCIIGFSMNAQDNKAAVEQCFHQYKNAILEGKGAIAADYVDSKTISYYDFILEQVKHRDSVELFDLNLNDRLMILSVRHRINNKNLHKIDGKGLFILSIDNGLISKTSLAGNEIGDVAIEDKKAKAQLLIQGIKTPVFMEFVQEKNKWKLNITSMFEQTSTSIQKMAKRSKMTENEFMLLMLEKSNNIKPNRTIWNPIK